MLFYTFSKTLNNGDDDGNVSGITFYNLCLRKAVRTTTSVTVL